jgi:hypothetical protein
MNILWFISEIISSYEEETIRVKKIAISDKLDFSREERIQRYNTLMDLVIIFYQDGPLKDILRKSREEDILNISKRL